MQIKSRAYAFVITSLFTGSLLPIMLFFSSSVDIFEFFMVTYLIAIAFAMALVVKTKKMDTVVSYLKDWKKLGTIALIGLLSYIPIEYAIAYAEHFVSASLATVVFRTNPLLMLLLLPVVLRERLTKYQIGALLLAFAGLYIAVTGGDLFGLWGNADIYIVLFLIAAALAYAFSSVLMKKHVFDIDASILLFNVTMFAFSAIMFLATGVHFSSISPLVLLAMFYVGVANNIVGFYTYFYGFRILKATVVTNIFFLSPFMTILFAHIILGETIHLYYIAIAVLVSIGMMIQRLDKHGGTYHSSSSNRFTIFDVTGAFANTGELAINRAIDNGGRVFAVKLEGRHRQKLDELLREGNHANVYMGDNPQISGESTFCKDIMGVKDDDHVVLRVGDTKSNEEFFSDLSSRIEY
ncbi:MAG: EamA family transporter [Candidatus Micrarchaeota archaeon]|nr:EamA family transporter [Candidatus Micrarchaeota archaeon]MDE1849519.1 EamA family transporter [Candidatus Micrarchaeota archaeon]